ncbi:MAG: glycyl-radical enzyme activating protein [Syntrophales bacterium]|jgi:pyruvate formate lyase activating enzyme
MSDKQSLGTVFDIQRYSIHDGPGIRTLIFMKGCPLRCLWCANPEGQRFEPSLLFIERLCIGCQKCISVCPTEAIAASVQGIKWNKEQCDECFKCIEVCHSKARQVCGKLFTVEQLLSEVEKDRAFYRRSGGGVTIGGGEPLSQPEFCRDFLKEAKRRNLHTALETCGYAEWDHLQSEIEYTDLLFVDIKHMNPVQHKKLTGKSNELILENIRRASRVIDGEGKEIIIRIPVIPTLNDSVDNIRATAEFVRGLGKIKKIELLPYHNMGQAKYIRTKWTKPYSLHALEPISRESIQTLKDIVESNGLVAEISGAEF